MWKQIQECEKRIDQNRRIINGLLLDFRNGKDADICRMKIEHLQREVLEMEIQLRDLKMLYSSRFQMSAQNAYNAPVQMAMQQPVMRQQAPVQQPVMQQQTPVQQPVRQQPMQQQMQSQTQPTQFVQAPKDVEKIVGKSLMGVIASVLIFVSLIVFGTLVIPLLGDTAKMSLMFAVSLIFAIVGNLLLLKDGTNKWFLSIAGCGTGAVYISLLMTRMYFNAISDITLYVLILIWAVVVCILSRLRSKLFLVIGQSGILISVIFGVVHCISLDDGNKLLFLVIYFLLVEGVFYVANMAKEYGRNLLNNIATILSLFFLTIAVFFKYDIGRNAGIIAAVMVVCLLIMQVVLSMTYFTYQKSEETIAFGLFNAFYYFLAVMILHMHFGEYRVAMLIMTALVMVALELIDNMKFSGDKELIWGRGIFGSVLMAILLLEVISMDFLFDNTGFVIPAVVFMLYGYMKKKELYKIPGLVLALLCILIPIKLTSYLICGTVVLFVLAVLVWYYKDQYALWIKGCTYPALLIFIITNFVRVCSELSISFRDEQLLLLLTILAIINITAIKLPFLHTNLKTGEKEKGFLLETGIIHAIMMLFVTGCILNVRPLGLHFLAILLGIVLYTVNTFELIKNFKGVWSSVYIGGKLFFLMIVILESFDAPDVTFSIVALIFAICFVVVGFITEIKTDITMKPLRICGLILTFISVVKLLLIDIHYDDKVILAANLFLSGLLCFAISFVYNMVDKKVLKNK